MKTYRDFAEAWDFPGNRDFVENENFPENRDFLENRDFAEQRNFAEDWSFSENKDFAEIRNPSENNKRNTFEIIYEIVRQIPYGQVASYGQIAALAGNKRLSRVVGYALHVSPDPAIPCHRVVNRLGEVSPAFVSNGVNRQVALLEAEGVHFRDGRVDMEQYQWKKMRY